DIFVTSKVWNDHLTYDQATAAYNDSLAKLGLDYLDLYLIHWPGNKAYKEAYQALEDLYKAKKIRAIGVSNFEIHHLEDLLSYATVKPVMNQIELHPMLDQHEVRAFMDANDIATQAWSPLMQGQILDNAVITAIAAKHGKSAAQVTLRWEFQQGILFNVKSVKVERMIANKDIFDFELSAEEMSEINALNQNLRVGPNPDEFDFVM
ncbi:MAG: aldo/keto reductase, partial [Leuconostoc falkenbergense]|uniref:aldo/keto reductase n=1 Tax=Leuconostoc falkenbergense TaxID=2766470 RepID=UPI003BB677F1